MVLLTKNEKLILGLAYIGKNKGKYKKVLNKPVMFQTALTNYILLKATIGKRSDMSARKRMQCREFFFRHLYERMGYTGMNE